MLKPRATSERLLLMALAALALWCGSLPGSWAAGPKAKGPSIRMIVSPRAGFAPLTVRARAWVSDPSRRLHCPTVVWDWGDGCVSKHLEDCDPYAMEGTGPDRYAPDPPAPHVYRVSGDYTVTVLFIPSVGRSVAQWQQVIVR